MDSARPVRPDASEARIELPMFTNKDRERNRAAVERLIKRHRVCKAPGEAVSDVPAWVETNQARDECRDHPSQFRWTSPMHQSFAAPLAE
jgi:hypothetical protein